MCFYKVLLVLNCIVLKWFTEMLYRCMLRNFTIRTILNCNYDYNLIWILLFSTYSGKLSNNQGYGVGSIMLLWPGNFYRLPTPQKLVHHPVWSTVSSRVMSPAFCWVKVNSVVDDFSLLIWTFHFLAPMLQVLSLLSAFGEWM